MINLKKLAMISAMGMVLSTGAMAAAVDGSKEFFFRGRGNSNR